MRWFITVLALLTACRADNDQTYPIIPASPVGPVGAGVADARTGDAASDAVTDAAILQGRVCLVSNFGDVATCASTGAGNLTVTLGASTATTSDSGQFTIAAPAASSVVWHVTGSSVQTTLAPFSASSTIPVATLAAVQTLESQNGVLEVAGQGAILAHVVAAGAPVEQVTATTTPIGADPVFYDGATAQQWTQNSTGSRGAIWIPGLPVGNVTLAVTPAGGAPQSAGTIPVAEGALTFVTVEIAPQNSATD